MEVVHRGIDKLVVSFKGVMSADNRDKIREAKNRAAVTMQEEKVTLGGVDVWVKETGATGGYQFAFHTGPDGERWVVRDRDWTPEDRKKAGCEYDWNVRVDVSAVQCALKGWEGVKFGLLQRLQAFGIEWLQESVARVDFAVDIVAPDFQIDPERIVAHSHCTTRAHCDASEDTFDFAWRGRRVATVTVGKMPGRQVTIYDKRLEAKLPGKGHWFEIWGVDRDECPPVWRVEVRAGKKHLDDWNCKTFDDCEAMLGDIFVKAMLSVRYLARACRDDENVTRVPSDEIWIRAKAEIADALENSCSGAVQGRVVRLRKHEARNVYVRQIIALATSVSAVEGWDFRTYIDHLPDLMADIGQAYVGDHIEAFKKFTKARDRLAFLHVKEQPEGIVA